jgi:hypothetical protein
MSNPCDSCNGICWQEISCPECLGSGIWKGTVINGIAEPNWFGLQNPLNFLESCPQCRGNRYITVFCSYYFCQEGD